MYNIPAISRVPEYAGQIGTGNDNHFESLFHNKITKSIDDRNQTRMTIQSYHIFL